MRGSKPDTVSVKIYTETRDALEEEKSRRKRAAGVKPDYAELLAEAVTGMLSAGKTSPEWVLRKNNARLRQFDDAVRDTIHDIGTAVDLLRDGLVRLERAERSEPTQDAGAEVPGVGSEVPGRVGSPGEVRKPATKKE
jgi:hypothetical protein